MRVLALVLAVILSTGCATRSPEVVKLYPPGELLLDCEHPAKRVATNGQMAETIKAYDRALTLCNNDKAALREWRKD